MRIVFERVERVHIPIFSAITMIVHERSSVHLMRTKILAQTISILLLSCVISGCIGDEEGDQERTSLVIAYEVSADMLESGTNPEILADHISKNTNFDVSIYTVDSKIAVLEALRFGNVDIAYMDSGNAWIGWNQYGLEVLAADQKSDGRSYYNAHAWVLDDSEIAIAHLDSNPLTNPFSLMEGKTSCHTGWLESVGMMLPMGFLLGLGYANVLGDPNDIESLRGTIHGFFSDSSSIPDPGTPYYGLSGALKCLSEGAGQIAFVKDNTISDYCPEDEIDQREDWCLENSRYVALPSFAKAPSDVFVYNPDYLQNESISDITNLLMSLGEEQDSSDVLFNTFGTMGVVETNSDDHLGIYSSFVSSIPGISAYYVDDKDEEEITISLEELRIAFQTSESTNGTDKDPSLLADFLSSELGVNVSVIHVDSDLEAISSLESGDAHLAFTGHLASVVGWKMRGLAVLAAIQNDDQTLSSQVSGWALSDSELASYTTDNDESTNPFDLIAGMVSCHTGTDPYSSLIAPLSHMISNGYLVMHEDSGSISLEDLVRSHFSEDSAIPNPDESYYGESGAIRCISEDYGQIAFVGENFIEEHCNNHSGDNSDWCLGTDNYTSIGGIGIIPTTSVMYNPELLDTRSRASIINALIDMNYDMYLENYSRPGMGTYTGCYDISVHKVFYEIPKESCGDEILKNILEGSGVARVTSQGHLGQFSDNLMLVPGAFEVIESHLANDE